MIYAEEQPCESAADRDDATGAVWRAAGLRGNFGGDRE
jgi:hypothetical protein